MSNKHYTDLGNYNDDYMTPRSHAPSIDHGYMSRLNWQNCEPENSGYGGHTSRYEERAYTNDHYEDNENDGYVFNVRSINSPSVHVPVIHQPKERYEMHYKPNSFRLEDEIYESLSEYDDIEDYPPPDYGVPGPIPLTDKRRRLVNDEQVRNMENSADTDKDYTPLRSDMYVTTTTLRENSKQDLACCSRRCFQISMLIFVLVLAVLLASVLYIVLRDEGPDVESTTTAPIPECWSTWNDWGNCDQSCGEGIRSRTRECLCESCIGRDSDVETCNEALCPRPEYGEWTPWTEWSACSASCDGGSQTRQRTCVQEEHELPCIGNIEQVRDCSIYDCPDCNRTCPNGGIVGPDLLCIRCICAEGIALNGRVTDTYNIPLAAVMVSDSVWPSEVLDETDGNGNFDITDACVGIELRFDRVGYVTHIETIEPEPDPHIYKIEKIDLLHIDSHPEDRLRVLGESVKFCCSVTGSPEPQYYEWLFNGQLVEGQEEFTNELEISSVTVDHAGEYQCRAVNDYSAVTSSPAFLNIQEQSTDFCQTSPQTFLVQIEGCKEGETVELDVGMCEPLPCHPGSRDSANCGREGGVCCGPVKIDNSQISCDNYMLPVYFVGECGCMECPPEGITIRGAVVSFDSGLPIPFAQIYIDNTPKTSTDRDGSFIVTIDEIGDNLNLVIAAYHSNYVRTMKEIVISEPGSIQAVALVMFDIQDSFQIESSDDSVIPLTMLEPSVMKRSILLENGNFGNITVPANSFLNLSGEIYDGPVNASLTNIDTQDINQMLNSPGELNFINDDGEKQPLHTFTMFSISFIDSLQGEPLQLKNDILITLKLPYDPSEDPLLFSLNEDTGIWQYLATLHKNISTEITVSGKFTVSQEYSWLSVSSPISKEEICYSKIRIFETDAFKKQVEDISSIKIVVDDQTYSEGKHYYGEIAINRAFSDSKTNYDGYCIAHSCQREGSSKEYHGSFFVEYSSSSGTSFLNPAIENTGISSETMEAIEYTPLNISSKPSIQALLNYNSIPPENIGPYYDQAKYDWKSSPTCSSLPEEHFRFYVDQSTPVKCTPSGSYTVQDVVLIPPPNPSYLNNLAWFGRSERLLYGVCYIKLLLVSPEDVSFRAFSKVGNLSYEDEIIAGQSIYGFRDKCQSTAMCLEIKHSGKVYDNSTDNTVIDIYQLNKAESQHPCSIKDINDNLVKAYQDNIINGEDGSRFQMFIQDTPYGETFGIFCAKGESSERLARLKAQGRCYRGDNDDILTLPTKENELNWAVSFECL